MWLGLVTTLAIAGPNGDMSEAPSTDVMTCEPPDLQGLVPATGATDVPTDAVVTLLVNESASVCGVSSSIADDHGAVVGSTVEVLGDLLRVRPLDALLPDRTYTVAVSFALGTIETTFSTVSTEPVPLADPTDVAIDVAASCGTSLEIAASASADLDPAAVGVLSLAVVGGYWDVEVDHAVAGGAASLAGVAYGVPDACVSLRLYDVTGALAWESDPECLDGTECPVPPAVEGLDLAVERSCDSGAGLTYASITVALPAEPAEAGGSLFAELVTERASARSETFPWTPGGAMDLAVGAAGDRDACASITYVDVWGVEQWTSEPVCAPAGEGCPWEDDLDGVGGCGGCTSGGGPVGLLPLAILLVIGRRRSRGR